MKMNAINLSYDAKINVSYIYKNNLILSLRKNEKTKDYSNALGSDCHPQISAVLSVKRSGYLY